MTGRRRSRSTEWPRAAARRRSLVNRTAPSADEQQSDGRAPKSYDRAYFDHWYRSPAHRVQTVEGLGRKVRMAFGIAEYLLGRPVQNVLDIGCGEGAWFPIVRKLRPGARYIGLDPSPYVLRRFGRRRNIRYGSLADLSAVRLVRRVDLVVCSDVLQYIETAEIERGLSAIRRIVGGVAYVEAFATEDAMEGDDDGWRDRSAATYRRMFRRAGLVQCGPYCYVDPEKLDNLNSLEHM